MSTTTLIADRGTGEPISLGAALTAGKKVRPDAMLLLEQDHREALGYFDWYEAASDDTTRIAVARKLCGTLRAHMQVEEEIFYPIARELISDESVVDHGVDEHKEARGLIEQAEAEMQQDRAPDELIRKLHAAIEDHIDDEETDLFPALRDAEMDSYEVGRRLAARKVELLFELTGRQQGGASQPKESDKVEISKEEAHKLFLAGLRDVHAAVRQGKELVERALERIESYPHVSERLRAHLDDKNAQLERVEAILESLGESRSAFKDFTMASAGDLVAMMNAATEDEILKSSLYTFGLANFEAASYESLLILGSAAGHTDAVKKLQLCLNEERAMAAWLAQNLRGLIYMHLQLRSEGKQASH